MKCSKVKMTNKIRRDVMSNAWYIFRNGVYGVKSFGQALAKAWWNMKRRIIELLVDGFDPNVELNRIARSFGNGLVAIPEDYYGKKNTYYGD